MEARLFTPGLETFTSFYAAQTVAEIYRVPLKEVRYLLYVEAMYAIVAQNKRQAFLGRVQKNYARNNKG